MILSKDNNTLNMTASILSAKSMLQSKLDGIGIDVRNIENALNALQNEIVQLKVEVEETKGELVTTAEELKVTTDNEQIKHLIDEVETTLDEIEINDDILEGLCLSSCNMNDDACFLNVLCNVVQDGSTGCTDCYGYSGGSSGGSGEVDTGTEIHYTDCYSDWDSYCTSCYQNGFDESCGQAYVDCSNGYCHAGFSDNGYCRSEHQAGSRDCPTEFKNDCINGYVSTVGGKDSITCLLKYVAPGLLCGEMYEEGENDTICTIDFNEYGLTCKQDHYKTDDDLLCYSGYTDPETGKHCNGDFSDTAEGGPSCLYDYGDGDTDCFKGYFVDSNGIVSCESGHSGDDGSCEGGHTWKDDIGGSCKSIFHNSTMNCQGGVAQDKTEERLLCDGDYDSGNINCHGGYGEDIDDQITFCPSNFTNGVTTCRNMYMKQNGVETCTNNDPISCGSCVGGYCDYCGGCVGNCDSCRGCHGSSDCGSCDGSCVSSCDGNCWHTTFNTCNGCYPSPYNTTCGAPSCGTVYDYCAANRHSITCTGGF